MEKGLKWVKDVLKDRNISALLVRSTDRYFNEYVPKGLSLRRALTGFDGSLGDAIIGGRGLHLFVDGRYSLQAKEQAKGFLVHVTSGPDSIETAWLNKLKEILKPGDVLAYDPNTVDLSLFDRLIKTVKALDANLVEDSKITEEILGGLSGTDLKASPIFLVKSDLSGEDAKSKADRMRHFLKENSLDGFLVVKLDDIAWLTNLRSYSFPYQSSIPGLALMTKDKLFLGLANGLRPKEVKAEICSEHELWPKVKESFHGGRAVVGIDPRQCSKAHEMALRTLNIEIKNIENPISGWKSIKNDKELLHMRSAFARADQAVYQTQNFITEAFEKGQAICESDVDLQIQDEFNKTGATELSFRPICASGKNGAVIHYGSPDHHQAIKQGSLFLLDTGAYYEGGYATDLTRTFLLGPRKETAKPWQKEMFTLVLKASIAGLSARFKRGTCGMQLDAIVRAPLWQAGLDFAHGTGHGIGINVHEFPPRIGPSSTSTLFENQVFSIEPGLYFKDLGGVRIENLATVVKDPENEDFLRILPLTFCPLDERLIDHGILDAHEESFLVYFKEQWQKNSPWPDLPPIKTVKFG